MATDQEMSVWLSDILDDIGVVDRRRCGRSRSFLIKEIMDNTALRILSKNCTMYYVGSQSEGTTTRGLNSDHDILGCQHTFTVTQDLSELKPYKTNMLMIQDETVTPGYCYLQAPSIFDLEQFQDFLHRDSEGRLLIKNTVFELDVSMQHGPALATRNVLWLHDSDIVKAFACKSWPLPARQWLERQSEGRWPSKELKRECSQTNCFVVAVGCKGSRNEQIEWRISTTLAERCLMFSLNTTQIKCYVLMKMILKTYLEEPPLKDLISSYMCKTILFHRMASTDPDVWNDRNLFSCLKSCLSELYFCIMNEKCPHFIIQDNNLMSGRFSEKEKKALLEKVCWLVDNLSEALLGIKCDDFGDLFSKKSRNSTNTNRQSYRRFENVYLISNVIRHLLSSMSQFLHEVGDNQYNQVLCYLLISKINSNGRVYEQSELEKTVYSLYIQQFSSAMGSTLASAGIQRDNTIPSSALKWMKWGLDTDVSSSRLKLASMYYCIHEMKKTEMELENNEVMYNQNKVCIMCNCNRSPKPDLSFFHRLENVSNLEDTLKYKTALCVRFLPSEMNCVPHELKYEMFRSTPEDLAYRGEYDYWMDWAVVDSITFLYFLQYKTYSYLGRQVEKQRALNNLERIIKTTINPSDRETAINLIHQDPIYLLSYMFDISSEIRVNLGHGETAWNLLGQCLEQEGRPLDALKCYSSSLKVRERNNAANIHICRLLSSLINECHCDIL